MTRTVHRILSGGGAGAKTVYYQTRPGGPKLSQPLCSHHDCPNEILSAKRKMEYAKRMAKMEVEVAQLQKKQKDIKRQRQEMELKFQLSTWKSAEPLLTPSPPLFKTKRQKTSPAAPDCDCEFVFSCPSSKRKGDHSFKARLSSTDTSCNPDLFRRFIFKAVFDCRSKLVSTASVDTFTKVISSRRSEVFRAKLYPIKHDEKDYNRFIEKYAKEILFWKVAEKVWVYAIPPFVLSQLDTRMRIVLVKQG
eukprot:CAMPEP_0201739888 /NCGR_PEP_ID=MMETSP0593-20130828/46020_1 /ASSEMBLY_ACC=CAM_ASM_000672 /TAXON_ID=267983 /ORGANISM="Skeletonema japonicum, Strain CCMP2506" /LENGTH=248 /DNA_ID=CAMNT_0048234183 /DNA_START=546 /DNA_END=1292 /DNA_ORIENTATION=+